MTAPDQRIRQVAIVLQSLDSGTSRGLLAQLPAEMARAVRQAMVNLGPVTPKERSQAMSGLQGMLGSLGRAPTSPTPSSVDEDSSPAATLIANSTPFDQIEISPAAQKNAFAEPHVNPKATLDSEIPWLAWEPASLALFLADERPTVIATVLNQLSPERAKTLLDHLPISTASATLAAIPDLFLTDPQILSDILAEIDRKLPKSPPVQKTATIAGISKLTAIIDLFGESQKQAWLDSIALQNESVAKQLGWSPAMQPRSEAKAASSIEAPSNPIVNSQAAISSATISPTATIQNATIPTAIAPSATVESVTKVKPTIGASEAIIDDIFDDNMIVPISRYKDSTSKANSNNAQDEAHGSSDITSRELTTAKERASDFDMLLELSDTDLVTLLHACDKSTVLNALCGASKRVIQRIERLVPRNEVKRFRMHLKKHASEPSNASELAQTSILLRAEELMVASRISALSSVTFVSAA